MVLKLLAVGLVLARRDHAARSRLAPATGAVRARHRRALRAWARLGADIRGALTGAIDALLAAGDVSEAGLVPAEGS